MTKKRRHLLATLGFIALSVLFFCLLTWALVEGAVVANFSSDARIQSNTAGHAYVRPNTVYTREDNPGRYWLVVGLLGFFGTLFGTIAALEHGSYRLELDFPERDAAKPRRSPRLTTNWQEDERSRQQRAEAPDPGMRAAVHSVVHSFNSRFKMTGVGLLEIPDPATPHRISLYLVFPELSDLDKPEIKEASLEASVRKALRKQGFPGEFLDHVSIHRTSTEVVKSSFGADILSQINQS